MLVVAAGLGVFQIITRFVLEQPAEWSEILIRISLIWMVFLGIPTAFRQGAMVSVDVLYRWSPPKLRRVLDWVVCLAALALIAVIIWWGWDYAKRGSVQSDGRPGDRSRCSGPTWRCRWAACSASSGIIGNLLDPEARSNWRPRNDRQCNALDVTRWCCASRSPISVAVSIGLAAILGIQASNANMLISVKEMFNSINKFPLAAIPFFILAGNLMETGGISRRLVEFAKSLVGGVQGGLPMTCVLTCMIFAAVSGSSVATTFAIGAILIPGADQARLPDHLCGRAAGDQRRTRRDHPAVDPDDPVRRERRGLDRRAVHRRLRAGHPDRPGADGFRLRLVQMQGLGQERRRWPPAASARPLCRPAGRC